MKRPYSLEFSATRTKVIVGEGEADRNFFAHLCVKHGMEPSFTYAFTGMANKGNGFSAFGHFLSSLPIMARDANVTDAILVADATDDPASRFRELCRQIEGASGNGPNGPVTYRKPSAPNVTSDGDATRVHALLVPMSGCGGLETLCLEAAIDAAGADGAAAKACMDAFATCAASTWNTEKRDKLRLNAFLGARHKDMPERSFYEILDLVGDKAIPLRSAAFTPLVDFIKAVEAL